jgi:hypothetical protein
VLAYRRRFTTTERETWRFTLSADRARPLRWDLGLDFHPGVTSSSGIVVEGDPLGGFRFAPSTSPSRLRLRLSTPAPGSGSTANPGSFWVLPRVLALEGLWGVSSQGPRFEIWCTVAGGTHDYRPLIP